MGISVLFCTSTIFTTILVCLYWSIVNHVDMKEDLFLQNNGERNTQEKCSLTDIALTGIDTIQRVRLKKIIFLQRGNIFGGGTKPSETLQFPLIAKLHRGRNKAAFGNSLQCVRTCNREKKFILVTNFISLEEHYKDLSYHGYKPTFQEIQARLSEITTVLQYNLNHPQIKTLVVLVESIKVARFLLTLDLDNSQKLIVQNANMELTMPETFEFATRCFLDDTIVISNQDVIFGQGWDLLDYKHLEETKSMYALTRHSSTLNPGCSGNAKLGVCGVDYSLSHDAFVFKVKNFISKKDIPWLRDQPYNIHGVENIVIWTFRNKFGYKVTNPCSLLHIHHEHCIAIRNTKGSESIAGNQTIWGGAEFTNTLY